MGWSVAEPEAAKGPVERIGGQGEVGAVVGPDEGTSPVDGIGWVGKEGVVAVGLRADAGPICGKCCVEECCLGCFEQTNGNMII